ncbi:MAG: hypothetical protein IIA03_10220 [Proteobacteria bacterium]|jgi:hypothetical protein|nr:hypothetical protein [Methylibium sp.]MBY0367460.1 hypothetical protein [Burkholderiaceae bacterium]MCH8856593.1 hypothetical protein [Pseudomonadota bacterium]|mmetsp:Transcript_27737/g.50091  ORF Transcript_27737/g.50091 Transcript_27737/m.50091 type:complete len:88 (+) Transcript_27737:1365-1628(+)
MSLLVSRVLRVLFLVAGAVVGLCLLLLALGVGAVMLLVGLLTGRRPALPSRVSPNPWAPRRAPAREDVVDVEVREVRDAPPGLPRQH